MINNDARSSHVKIVFALLRAIYVLWHLVCTGTITQHFKHMKKNSTPYKVEQRELITNENLKD